MRSRPEAALLAIEAGRPDEATLHLEICRAIIAQGEDWLGLAGAVERAERRNILPAFKKGGRGACESSRCGGPSRYVCKSSELH
jgi:hypothetical protein